MGASYENLVLAFDIDDTLVPISDRLPEERLAGLDALSALTTFIEAVRSDSGGIYFGSVTGRSFASHQEYEVQVPAFGVIAETMDFKITSVGTEARVRTLAGFAPVADWPQVTGWHPRTVRSILSAVSDLTLQPDIAQGDYKVSFNVGDNASKDHAGTVAKISEHLVASGLAANVILSGTCLDILPRDVHKGAGLLHVISSMAIDNPFIVAAGDSMNDADLLQAADLAIVPSNAHSTLIHWAQKVIDPRKLYQTRQPFAAGVHEGLNWVLNQ